MQIVEHQSPTYRWQIGSISPREIPYQQLPSATTMSNRMPQPLIFSIEDRLAEQHLTRLDLCSKNLKRIDKLPNNINFNVILLDYNDLTKIEHLDGYPQLIQLSISHNRLTDIYLLHRIRSLQKLNLSYNLIESIDCLKTLQNLVMLNISNNNLYSIAILNSCHALQSLDVSGNAIQQIEDLSHLTSLKYLNLHKNFLETLSSAPRSWPKSLHTLVISDNEIQDLTEVSSLSTFINLNTLYIINNPCLSVVDERHGCHQPFDYRPYVLNWCLSIHNLDGMFITRKESLKAEWLLSQGKGRAFGSGEHTELVQYLIKVCGTNTEERDDLHLSRIMLQQDLYNQQRRLSGDEQIHSNEDMLTTSDTMKDANETLSKHTQGKFQQSTLISESEFLRVDTSHPTTTTTTVNDHSASAYHQQMRTPSPAYARPSSYNDDPITENSSSKRYTNYDNRPIKPLDQNMLQTKLNQYPVDDHSNDNLNSSRSQTKRASPNLVYNANRYSPKTTTRGPTASSSLHTRSTRNLIRQRYNRTKRQTINSSTTNALRALHYSNENSTHHLTTMTSKVKTKEQQSSNANKNHDTDDDDIDEIQMQFTRMDRTHSARSATMNNSVELQKLTTSVETMRASVLQAYLDLHERFTKTTELQTSALSALWKKCETQHLNHQRETERITQENRLLHQRIRELEARLNNNQFKSVPLKHNPDLSPPLRAHISKRDTKSFFLHWIPNPLNKNQTVLGYRIYIDDKFIDSVDSGRFEAIIDCIRDEGEYKIKIRTYNQDGESIDSNIVVARFRRQRSSTPNSDPTMIMHTTPTDQSTQNSEQKHITPEKQIIQSNEHISPKQISPHLTTTAYENIISRKPPKSPTSSPGRAVGKTSPNNGSCSKVLFDNNNSDSTPIISTKRSPTRAGIMSRLTKNSHHTKRNNILLNALPIEGTNSPTELTTPSKVQIKLTKRTINFQTGTTKYDHGDFLVQRIPIKLNDISNSMSIHHLSTNTETLSSNSSSPPPPIPPRLTKTSMRNSLDQ